MSSTRGGLHCTIMRGGTSKAIFLWADALPAAGAARDAMILDIFGSPDIRQIDGLGGADPLTSKLAIISRDAPAGYHLSYTFAQVGIANPLVDYESLCGNISAAVGHFAVEEGLCQPDPGSSVATVVVFNTNHGRRLQVEVPCVDGMPAATGDFAISGVPGTGSRIRLDLADTGGSHTGKVLPSGRPIDVLAVGSESIEVSLVDAGNPHVFMRASDFGITGTEAAAELDEDHALGERVERFRRAAAAAMGMEGGSDHASPAIPIAVLVSTPVPGADVDLTARAFFMQKAHKAYPGTSTVCTGVAAQIPGTIVAQLASRIPEPGAELRIGHPAGIVETSAKASMDDGTLRVSRATVDRTARRILDGVVYLKPTSPAQPGGSRPNGQG